MPARFSLRKRRKQIPALAGMTKRYSVVIAFYNTVMKKYYY